MLADFEALASGSFGLRDTQGIDWRPLLLFGLADEECRCNDWGLPHWTSAENCTECKANRSDLPYTDLQEGAGWRGTVIMRCTTFLARVRVPAHPLVKSKFMWRWFFPDLMHMMDCKGVCSIVYGGILARLTRHPALGNNIADRLKVVNAKLEQYYHDNPGTCRLPRIALDNVFVAGWVVLNDPAIKAANRRYASVVLETWLPSTLTMVPCSTNIWPLQRGSWMSFTRSSMQHHVFPTTMSSADSILYVWHSANLSCGAGSSLVELGFSVGRSLPKYTR